MTCLLCGAQCADRAEMGGHLATEHPAEWEMAVQVVAAQMGFLR